jgi:hypothetical protein
MHPSSTMLVIGDPAESDFSFQFQGVSDFKLPEPSDGIRIAL